MSQPMSQLTLIKESDVRLTRALVARSIFYRSDEWCSNGIWALRRNRVGNPKVFECLGCLETATKATNLQNMQTWKLVEAFPAHPETWTRTQIVEVIDGTDFTQFVAPSGDLLLVPRAFVEGFALEGLYGHETGPLWDADELTEATIAIMPALGGAQMPLPILGHAAISLADAAKGVDDDA